MNSSCPVYNPRSSPPEHHVRHKDYVGYETFDHGYGSVVPVGAPNEEDTLPTSYPESIELQRVPVSQESPLPHRHWSVMNSLRSVVSRCGMAVRSVFVREKPIGGAEAQRPLIEHDIEKQSGSVQDCADGEHCGEENPPSQQPSPGMVRRVSQAFYRGCAKVAKSPVTAVVLLAGSIVWLTESVTTEGTGVMNLNISATLVGVWGRYLVNRVLTGRVREIAWKIEDYVLYPIELLVNNAALLVSQRGVQIAAMIGNDCMLGALVEGAFYLPGADAREKEKQRVVCTSGYSDLKRVADEHFNRLRANEDWGMHCDALQVESQEPVGASRFLVSEEDFDQVSKDTRTNLDRDDSCRGVLVYSSMPAFLAAGLAIVGNSTRLTWSYMFRDWARILAAMSVGFWERFGVDKGAEWLQKNYEGTMVAKTATVAKGVWRYNRWLMGPFLATETVWSRYALGLVLGDGLQEYRVTKLSDDLETEAKERLMTRALVDMKDQLHDSLVCNVRDDAMVSRMNSHLDEVWEDVDRKEPHMARTVALSVIGLGLIGLPFALLKLSSPRDRKMNFMNWTAFAVGIDSGFLTTKLLREVISDKSSPLTKAACLVARDPSIQGAVSLYLYKDGQHHLDDAIRTEWQVTAYLLAKAFVVGPATAERINRKWMIMNEHLRWIVTAYLAIFGQEQFVQVERREY